MMTCCAFVYSVINLTKTKQYVFLIPVMTEKSFRPSVLAFSESC